MDRGTEIARVWSFSNDFMQTPYVVKRGDRNGWHCNCPQHTIRHKTCKHITATRDYKKQPADIQEKIQLTEAGQKLLGVKDQSQLNLV